MWIDELNSAMAWNKRGTVRFEPHSLPNYVRIKLDVISIKISLEFARFRHRRLELDILDPTSSC